MSRDVYEPDRQMALICKDCGFTTSDSHEFNEHVHVCPINPVKMPDAEVARRSGIIDSDD